MISVAAVLLSGLGSVPLRDGLVIRSSVKIRPGNYRIAVPEGSKRAGAEVIPTFRPAIVIRGNNLVVDFAGAVLRGSAPEIDPDKRKGLAIQVEGNNITLKNLSVHGYKVGLLARNCKGLRVLNSDFSYNWRQHLLSTPERENEADWMSYHHNENDEWLRYGAAMYLRGCDDFVVQGVRVTGGQNALMMNRCNNGRITENEFSFNSSIGIGMYRSSMNRISKNSLDWNVRGFSYGVYNRGQDSAGILVYEQSSKNTFILNSVTHGGDGFFLWAGQSTMDTGKGGCNDNLVQANDFSHAPTNGIEATFSRNVFFDNKIHECAHGIWGGYSFNSSFMFNDFADNQIGIAVEHGQDNLYTGNRFDRDDVAISLWANKTQDPNWGYAKARDTRSRSANITGNFFHSNALAIDLKRTQGTEIESNTFQGVGRAVRADDAKILPGNWEVPTGPHAETIFDYFRPLASRLGRKPFLPPGALRGWKYILVDEWGPYDFRRPLLWPERKPLDGDAPKPGANSAASSGTRRTRPHPPVTDGPIRYELLGPKGQWRVVSAEAVRMSETHGNVPGFVTIEAQPGHVGTTEVVLEYIGAKTIDSRGVVTPAGKPVRFGFSKFSAPIDWTVAIFPWTKSVDPSDPHSPPEPEALAAAPRPETFKTTKLDYASSGSFLPSGPRDRFATFADGEFDIPSGNYVLDVTSDDGIRIWVDGKKVLDEWHYQGPTPYAIPLTLGGHHRIRVEHFEIDGYSALQVKLRK